MRAGWIRPNILGPGSFRNAGWWIVHGAAQIRRDYDLGVAAAIRAEIFALPRAGHFSALVIDVGFSPYRAFPYFTALAIHDAVA